MAPVHPLLNGDCLFSATDKGSQADIEFGNRNGCKAPIHVLQYDWPLALDLVKQGFKAGRQEKSLALFTEKLGGTTAKLTILGGTGYVTKDPENIAAILSTQFDGASSDTKPITFCN